MSGETKKINEQIVLVDVTKLSQALRTTFEGIAMTFDSIGAEGDITIPAIGVHGDSVQAEEREADETAAVTESKDDAAEDMPEEENAPASQVSQDDITKIIVRKIKQDRSNNEKISQILKKYGVAKVSELPSMKYEAFVTDLAEI